MKKFWEMLEIILYETMTLIENMHIYVLKKINNQK